MTTKLAFFERQASMSSLGSDASSLTDTEDTENTVKALEKSQRHGDNRFRKAFKGITRTMSLRHLGNQSKVHCSDESLMATSDTAGSISSFDSGDQGSGKKKDLDNGRFDDDGSAVHGKMTSVASDLKLSGTTWKHTDDNTKYVQLSFVPSDTVILVRRAPHRTRSVRTVVRASSNDSMLLALSTASAPLQRTHSHRNRSDQLSSSSLHGSSVHGSSGRYTRRLSYKGMSAAACV